MENHFIEKLNAKRFFKNILKNSRSGRSFGVTLRHYQVKTIKVQTRIYKTGNNQNICVSYGYNMQKQDKTNNRNKKQKKEKFGAD